MYHMYHIGTSLAKHRELLIVWRMDAWGQCPCACGQRVHCHGSCWKPSTRLSGYVRMGNVFQILGDFLLILYGFLLDSCWILPSTNHGLFLTSKIIKKSEALRRGRLVMRGLPLSRCRCSMVQQPIESNWAKCSCSRLYSRLRSGLRSSCSSFPRPSPSLANVAISLRSPSWDPQHVTSPSLLSTRASRSRSSRQGLAAARLQHMCCQCCHQLGFNRNNQKQQMGLFENSVPLHPMVNDHYPYIPY